MAKKENTDKDTTLLGKFDALKKKHPDAMLLFRNGDFYELYREDAVKASVLLALKISEKIIPGEKEPVKLAGFPHHALDTYLPKLIRSGQRLSLIHISEPTRPY